MSEYCCASGHRSVGRSISVSSRQISPEIKYGLLVKNKMQFSKYVIDIKLMLDTVLAQIYVDVYVARHTLLTC